MSRRVSRKIGESEDDGAFCAQAGYAAMVRLLQPSRAAAPLPSNGAGAAVAPVSQPPMQGARPGMQQQGAVPAQPGFTHTIARPPYRQQASAGAPRPQQQQPGAWQGARPGMQLLQQAHAQPPQRPAYPMPGMALQHQLMRPAGRPSLGPGQPGPLRPLVMPAQFAARAAGGGGAAQGQQLRPGPGMPQQQQAVAGLSLAALQQLQLAAMHPTAPGDACGAEKATMLDI